MDNITYPRTIIVELVRQLDDLKLHLDKNWLPTIDIHALLSGLFTIFINPECIEQETNNFIFWTINEFVENRDLSDIQKLYIRDVLIKVIHDIHTDLYTKGLLNNYFPYGFKELLSTGSVVLSKIDSG